jgi:hypothetical protein
VRHLVALQVSIPVCRSSQVGVLTVTCAVQPQVRRRQHSRHRDARDYDICLVDGDPLRWLLISVLSAKTSSVCNLRLRLALLGCGVTDSGKGTMMTMISTFIPRSRWETQVTPRKRRHRHVNSWRLVMNFKWCNLGSLTPIFRSFWYVALRRLNH